MIGVFDNMVECDGGTVLKLYNNYYTLAVAKSVHRKLSISYRIAVIISGLLI